MRLVLELYGWNVLDVEILLLRRAEGAHELVVTHTGLEDAERAEPMEPDTIAFGFCHPERESNASE